MKTSESETGFSEFITDPEEKNTKILEYDNSTQISPGQFTPEKFKKSEGVSVAKLISDIEEKKLTLTEKDETIQSLKEQLENKDSARMDEIIDDLKRKNAKLRKCLQNNIQGATQLLKGINQGKS